MEVLFLAQIGVSLFHDVDFSLGGRNPTAGFSADLAEDFQVSRSARFCCATTKGHILRNNCKHD